MTARPTLETRYRGTGNTVCETFLRANGMLTSLFTYGTGNISTSVNFRPDKLSTHFRGMIYSISPGGGIFAWDPQVGGSTADLIHQFQVPTTAATTLCNFGWKTVIKDNHTQIMTGYFTTTAGQWRLVFVDKNGTVTESSNIAIGGIYNQALQRGTLYQNKLYTYNFSQSNIAGGSVYVIDPEVENISYLGALGSSQYLYDIPCVHNGKLYGAGVRSSTTVGLGNQLWLLSSAVPTPLIEWEGYQGTGPSVTSSASTIFSQDGELIFIGYPSGTTTNKFGCWKINFDSNDVVTGITDITDTVFKFNSVTAYNLMQWTTSKVYNPIEDKFETRIYFSQGHSSEATATPIHEYRWMGSALPAEYLGVGADSWDFDFPACKLGGGQISFTDAGELDFRVTDFFGSGVNARVEYVIDGTSEISGVAFCPKFNNRYDTPESTVSLQVIEKGVVSGDYIAGVTAGETGVFSWTLADNSIVPGDLPNMSAKIIRIA